MSESVENLADLAEKGLKKDDFTSKLLVFPTRFLGNFVDGKRVMRTLHQNRGAFFHFLCFLGLRNGGRKALANGK